MSSPALESRLRGLSKWNRPRTADESRHIYSEIIRAAGKESYRSMATRLGVAHSYCRKLALRQIARLRSGMCGFSSEMNLSGAAMSYGARCEDPTTGGMSNCEKPAWLRTELSDGLEKKELLNEIRAANSDVLLFVHGFNISFDESVKITLRIVERTGIQAIPVTYSWPSQSKVSAYGVDYDRNEWTIEHLKDFIQDLVDALPEGAVLHVVAHSMGNRAVLAALTRASLREQRLGQLVMIAPDVDSEIFKYLVLRSGPFRRKTLYVSSHDWALRADGWLHPGASRAGDARKQYVVVKGVDTIDMSPLKAGRVGHSVYEYSQCIMKERPASEGRSRM